MDVKTTQLIDPFLTVLNYLAKKQHECSVTLVTGRTVSGRIIGIAGDLMRIEFDSAVATYVLLSKIVSVSCLAADMEITRTDDKGDK